MYEAKYVLMDIGKRSGIADYVIGIDLGKGAEVAKAFRDYAKELE